MCSPMTSVFYTDPVLLSPMVMKSITFDYLLNIKVVFVISYTVYILYVLMQVLKILLFPFVSKAYFLYE